MIKYFEIQDFKSYSKAKLKLAPLTVLVGANASGKSNALEAIRFLSWLAQGQKLSSLQYKVNQDDYIVRGHIKDLFRNGKETFSIGCALSDNIETKLHLSFDFRNGEIHIKHEECTMSTDFLYKTVKPTDGSSTDIAVEYNNFARGGRKPQITCNDQLAIFTQMVSAARFSDGHEKAKKVIPITAAKFEKQLANILFLDPVPARMRDYSFISDKQLTGDGRNLSSVLYQLWNENDGLKAELLTFIQSLPEQDIKAIDFLQGPRNEVMVQLIETFGSIERKIDASLLSDGTLRVLAIASALLSAPEGCMVIIEEIDNGIHPSRAKRLLESIDSIARKRKLVILISSHNPALLDALPVSTIPNVVFCYRDKIDGNSKLISLEDIPDYPELIAQGTLGDLVTQGLLESFVKNYEGTEIKKLKALEWLKSIQ
jgi:predicted ATPase